MVITIEAQRPPVHTLYALGIPIGQRQRNNRFGDSSNLRIVIERTTPARRRFRFLDDGGKRREKETKRERKERLTAYHDFLNEAEAHAKQGKNEEQKKPGIFTRLRTPRILQAAALFALVTFSSAAYGPLVDENAHAIDGRVPMHTSKEGSVENLDK